MSRRRLTRPLLANTLTWLLIAAWLPSAQAATNYDVQITARYPHDRKAFTQGLVFAHGELYESIGLRGQSALRRIDLESGEVLAEQRLEDQYFAEGLALVGERLIQLTWQAGTGFVYDRRSLKKLASFQYPGEGWGLTYDGHRLILSDGSSVLRFLDPDSFKPIGSLQVTYQGKPVTQLNELEMVNGQIWANLWRYDLIVKIDPETGHVNAVIDARLLRKSLNGHYRTDVLNGIAYDAEKDRLFLTGKLWHSVFEVKLRAVGD